MKLRSFYSVLTGVVLVLLLAGGLGAVWLSTGAATPAIAAQPAESSPYRRAEKPSALTQPVSNASALFVSRQAVAVLSLLSNPERLSEFWLAEGTRESGKSGSRRQTELEALAQGVFAELGLDYSRDLKSWLGDETTFAVMSADIDRDAENGLQPGYLLVLGVRDPQQAEASVQAFWQRQAGNPLREQVAGIPLVSSATGPDQGLKRLASATVGSQYVLFANDPKVLRTALNNAQVPELNLERSFSYQQALEQVREPQAGFLFINIPELGPTLTQRLTKLSQLDLSPYDSLMLTLRPAAQGLQAEAVWLATSPLPSRAERSASEPMASPLLRFMPTASRFAIASRDLPQVWASAARLGQPVWQQALLDLQQNLDLPTPELVNLPAAMQGDFVLAQLPHPGRADDWLLVAQQSAQMADAVAQLDRLAQQQGMSLGSFQLAEQTIYAWTKLKPAGAAGAVSLQAEVQGLHAKTGDYELFATSLEALEQALSPDDSLAALAKSASPQLLQTPNQGYLYLDRTALDQRLQPNPLLKKLLRSTQSALIARYGADETSQRAAAFLRLVD